MGDTLIPTHRTQPYRQGQPRMPGMALQAMLQGRAPGAPINAADFNRQRMAAAAKPSLRDLALQQLGAPRATADVRGQFGGAGGLDQLSRITPREAPMQMSVDSWGSIPPPSTIPMQTHDRHAQQLHALILAALQAEQQHRAPRALRPLAHI